MQFTTRVLGGRAAERLRSRQVIQTIRGQPCPLGRHLVVLDGETLGEITVIGAVQRGMDTLTEEDAKRGGFDTLKDLLKALRRAGWRFRLLSGYRVWVIRFNWTE